MKKTFRCALIGCGGVSVMHFQALNDAGQDIVAVCDKQAEKAEKARDTYAPTARVYTDYKQMLAEVKPDAVHICTPHFLHFPMAKDALEAGCHVFLEKPVCVSEEEITRLTEVARASGKYLNICFQNRFLPIHREAYRLVEEWGGAQSARAMVTWKRDGAYYTASEWRGRHATEGGSTMINQAIHELDLLLSFMGQPLSVSATVANHHNKDIIETEDACEARILFGGDRVGLFYATTGYDHDAPNMLEIKCKEHTLLLYGNVMLVDGKPYAYPEDDNLVTSMGKSCWGIGHVRLISLFYDAIESGTPVPVSIESAAVAVRVLLACYRSHGQSVNL